MKSFLLPLVLVAAFSFTVSAQEPAAETNAPAQTPPARPAWVGEFEKLDEKTRQEYIEKFLVAEQLLQQKRILECLRVTEDIEKIFDGNPGLYNLKGACYMEIRDVKQALEYFRKALSVDPSNSSFEFNIAESLFVMHDYAAAAEQFSKILKGLPENPAPFIESLLNFKLYICYLKLGKDKEAEALEGRYGLLDDVPYYFCAMAVKAYHAGDKIKGQEAYLSAIRVFRDSGMLQPYIDAMQESGFIFSPSGQTMQDQQVSPQP